jgi:DNA-binding NtrC family response regulator
MAGVQTQLRPPHDQPGPHHRKPGVLVVDDDPVLLGLLNAALCKHGFEVWLAASGADAVQVYQRQRARINVVLLDVRMPGLDGPDTLAELQRVNAAVACCFMSGYTGEYTPAELLARGALHFFDKPFRLAEIVRVLAELAGRHDHRQANSA